MSFAPLAEELRRAGRLDEAIKTCEAGLAQHPEYTTARATLGRALLDRGNLEEALIELGAVLNAAPEHLSALKGVADIHARRGETTEALELYRRALALARGDADLARTIATLEAAAPVPPAPAYEADDDASATVRRLELFLDRVLADRARRH